MENYENFEIIIEESTDDEFEKKELTTYSYISNGLCFEYFIGYEIASLLGYKNVNDVLIKNVTISNRLIFKLRYVKGVKKS